jgi:putative nucleotidyltransferase with HDIG domain
MSAEQNASDLAASLAKTIVSERVLAFLPGLLAAMPEAEWFLVGGAVRDHVLGRSARKDYDLVVRKVSLEKLQPAFAKLGRVDLVGRDFGVLRFVPEGCEGEEPVDIAWPRTEKAGGSGGYRDFKVQADPDLALERDLARRDFTMNAVAFDLRTNVFIDPYDGLADIAAKTVRAVGDAQDRFGEDLSRILRGVRLACELGFTIDPATWDAIVALAPRLNDIRGEEPVVPRETVARNLVRALAADPVRALELLETSGMLELLIPELTPLATTKQSPDHHSEGDVWTHTKLALAALRSSAFTEFFPGETADAETVLATLFHDIGKPQTASKEGDRIRFLGHDTLGADMTRLVARRLRLSSVPEHVIDEENLAWLVHMHLLPNKLDIDSVKKTTLVKHFLHHRALGRRLLHLSFADASAALRPDGSVNTKNLRALVATLAELEAQGSVEHGKVKTVLSGEDIMQEMHLQPGPEVGRILAALQEAQLTGKVASADDAKKFLLANEKEA